MPKSVIDRNLAVAGARLRGARERDDEILTQLFKQEIDRLLDKKLQQRVLRLAKAVSS